MQLAGVERQVQPADEQLRAALEGAQHQRIQGMSTKIDKTEKQTTKATRAAGL
jgi:hypothetical protein